MYVRNCNLYADDTLLDATGKTIDKVTESLQLELNKLSLWFKQNHLTTNASKSCTMLIGSRQRIKDYVNRPNSGLTLDGDLIRNQINCRYLGVDIDSYLSFDFLTHKICNKLSSRVSMIQRLSQSIPTYYLNQLHYAFVQPFLDYCILIWGHTTENIINKIQRF